MNSEVSVIMGIYNCEKTLPVAIQSILDQTYSNVRLILCDDASTDGTYAVALAFQKRYPQKIILLRNAKNAGLAFCLNRCLQYAESPYIARMDGDDESCPTRIEEEVAYLDTHPDVECVGTLMTVFDEQGEHGVRTQSEYPNVQMILRRMPFFHATVVMRKSVYDKLNGYTVSADTVRAEDADFWFRFFAAGFRGYVLQKPLYRYRVSEKADRQKRRFSIALKTARVYSRGYKLLHFPLWNQVYALRPLLSALLPNKLMYRYHLKKDSRHSASEY